MEVAAATRLTLHHALLGAVGGTKQGCGREAQGGNLTLTLTLTLTRRCGWRARRATARRRWWRGGCRCRAAWRCGGRSAHLRPARDSRDTSAPRPALWADALDARLRAAVGATLAGRSLAVPQAQLATTPAVCKHAAVGATRLAVCAAGLDCPVWAVGRGERAPACDMMQTPLVDGVMHDACVMCMPRPMMCAIRARAIYTAIVQLYAASAAMPMGHSSHSSILTIESGKCEVRTA